MKKQIHNVLEDIKMDGNRKREIWEQLEQSRPKMRRFHVSKAIVAAACLVVLILPIGAFAAGTFQWPFSKETGEEKNKELNPLFRKEESEARAYGLLFRIEKALCDKSMKVGYFYVSVTDISGQNTNPADRLAMGHNENRKRGDVVFDFDCGGTETFDKEKSTDSTAYYYIETERKPYSSENIGELKIQFNKIDQMRNNGFTGEVIGGVTLEAKNVIEMPVLDWKEKNFEVRVSPIAASVKTRDPKELQIILKNNKTITDYFDYNEDKVGENGEIPKDTFISKEDAVSEGNQIVVEYRFGYVDCNEIVGIRYDGVFYGLKDEKKDTGMFET